MSSLEGRVAIVTGGGRGLGRAHARLLAAEGAVVVVNDLGSEIDGEGRDASSAQDVATEIVAAGGRAVADGHDVSTWGGGRDLVRRAVDEFGDLHVLVNNAGNFRERMLFNMSEDDWDSVLGAHLKGHFITTRWAASFWRERARAGDEVRASVINTSSASGLIGQVAQTAYGAAKAGIAAFTVIAAEDLGRLGVRVNAVVPAARTRMTDSTASLVEAFRAPETGFDKWDPANVSPLVAALAAPASTVTGQVFYAAGGTVRRLLPWAGGEALRVEGRWGVEDLAGRLEALPPLERADPMSWL